MINIYLYFKQKKKRRLKAVNHMMAGGNKYINRYPKKDLLKILGESGYHSEEWEETDAESEYIFYHLNLFINLFNNKNNKEIL
jgi:hypothetical protein